MGPRFKTILLEFTVFAILSAMFLVVVVIDNILKLAQILLDVFIDCN